MQNSSIAKVSRPIEFVGRNKPMSDETPQNGNSLLLGAHPTRSTKSIDDFLVKSLNIRPGDTDESLNDAVSPISVLGWRVPIMVSALAWFLSLSLLAATSGLGGIIGALFVLFGLPASWFAWQFKSINYTASIP